MLQYGFLKLVPCAFTSTATDFSVDQHDLALIVAFPLPSLARSIAAVAVAAGVCASANQTHNSRLTPRRDRGLRGLRELLRPRARPQPDQRRRGQREEAGTRNYAAMARRRLVRPERNPNFTRHLKARSASYSKSPIDPNRTLISARLRGRFSWPSAV